MSEPLSGDKAQIDWRVAVIKNPVCTPRLTSHWSGRPTQQAFVGFFGIIAGGPPLTGGVRHR
jgi:hypothetical protein